MSIGTGSALKPTPATRIPPDEVSSALRCRRDNFRKVGMRLTIMTVDTAKTVRELAVELPDAIRVFEKFGIDYCCGGHRTLEQACSVSKSQVDSVLAALTAAEASRSETPTTNWNDAPLADLM